jgi:hypothetical protein
MKYLPSWVDQPEELMRSDPDRIYKFVIEGIEISHFTKDEVVLIQSLIGEASTFEGNLFQGVWFHVQAQNVRTLHLSPHLIISFYNAVGVIVDLRRKDRIRKETVDRLERQKHAVFPTEEEAEADRERLRILRGPHIGPYSFTHDDPEAESRKDPEVKI